MTPPNLSLLMIMICFWLTLWLVNRYLILPVQAVLDERASKIDVANQDWLEQQESLQAATKRLEQELSDAARQAAAFRAEKRKESLSAREARMVAARKKADEKLSGVVAKLAEEAENVRKDLRTQSETLAGELAGRLLGREIRG